MSSSIDNKCQRCGSQFQGQMCPFCTITGLDVNALLLSDGLTLAPAAPLDVEDSESPITLIDVATNQVHALTLPLCRFGRDISNDIVLTGDKSLSRFHFQVTFLNGEFFVEDSGSRNGSFLNGSPVTAPRKIINGDIISAGMSRYRVVLNDTTTTNPPVEQVDSISAAAAESAHLSQSDAADPLAKIVAEGQALLNSTDAAPDSQKSLETAPTAEIDSEQRFNKYEKIEHESENFVDELFAATKGEEAEANASTADHSSEKNGADRSFVSSELPASEELPASPERPASTEPSASYETSAAQAESPAREPATGKKDGESAPDWPQWCKDFSIAEIKDVERKIEELDQEIKNKQEERTRLQDLSATAETLKNNLLGTSGQTLVSACTSLFEQLGWAASTNGDSAQEIVLKNEGTAVALAKIVWTDSQPQPADLASLVSSLSTYWSTNGVEPKGILVVAMLKDGPPDENSQLASDYSEYAAKKNVCLMTTVQLLSIYRDVVLRQSETQGIKDAILNASGLLPGFTLQSEAQAVS